MIFILEWDRGKPLKLESARSVNCLEFVTNCKNRYDSSLPNLFGLDVYVKKSGQSAWNFVPMKQWEKFYLHHNDEVRIEYSLREIVEQATERKSDQTTEMSDAQLILFVIVGLLVIVGGFVLMFHNLLW